MIKQKPMHMRTEKGEPAILNLIITLIGGVSREPNLLNLFENS